jgi:hypothetical protein
VRSRACRLRGGSVPRCAAVPGEGVLERAVEALRISAASVQAIKVRIAARNDAEARPIAID